MLNSFLRSDFRAAANVFFFWRRWRLWRIPPRLVSVLNPHYVNLSQPCARLFLGVSRSEMTSKNKDKGRNNETEGMHHEPTEPLLRCHCFTTPVAFFSSFSSFLFSFLILSSASCFLTGPHDPWMVCCCCCCSRARQYHYVFVVRNVHSVRRHSPDRLSPPPPRTTTTTLHSTLSPPSSRCFCFILLLLLLLFWFFLTLLSPS